VATNASDYKITDNNNNNNNPIQKNNRVSNDDLHSPNFDEAIAAIIDENGGVHLNDGPGSLFSLVSQDKPQTEQDVNVFVKPLNTDLRTNTRRGLPQNQIILINRTQLSTQPSSRTSNRYQQTQRQPQPQQYLPHHQVISTPLNFRDSNKPQEQQRPNDRQRSPRQRIHIIVNNRTTVQEIPIEDQIDFQRIIVTPSSNRYSSSRSNDQRRQPPTVITTQTLRTTTPTPRVTTERRVIPEKTYLTASERRVSNNQRPTNPRSEFVQPVVVPVRPVTIPQRPPPKYRTPEPYSLAVKCNERSCRLPDCYCGGTEIPGNQTFFE
jgi:hypothetical protein